MYKNTTQQHESKNCGEIANIFLVGH